MGEVELRREQRGDQSLVFAILPTGHAVWGMDLVTRQEWWYAPEYEASLAPVIHARAAALARPDAAHATFDRYSAAAATASAPAEPAATGGPVDLAQHRPGHSVLAQIAAKHAASASTALGDAPGVLDDDIVQWCVGYVGEEQVGSLLEALGPGWKVLHAVPVGTAGSDIDHVVIGPGGVFSINTKHHAGQTIDVKGDAVFVGGTHTFYARNVRLEAERTTRVLQTVVPASTAYPVVAVVGGTVRVKEPAAGVYVMNSAALTSWLLGLPTVLSPEQVAAVYTTMRWSPAWTRTPPPSAAPDWVAEFARQLAHDRAAPSRTRSPRTAGASARDTNPAGRTPTKRARAARPAGRSSQRSSGRGRGKKPRGIGEELARLAVVVAIAALLIWQLPGMVQNMTDRAKQRQQLPTPSPTVAVEKAGAVCDVRGATAVTESGRALVCKPAPTSTSLRWQAP